MISILMAHTIRFTANDQTGLGVCRHRGLAEGDGSNPPLFEFYLDPMARPALDLKARQKPIHDVFSLLAEDQTAHSTLRCNPQKRIHLRPQWSVDFDIQFSATKSDISTVTSPSSANEGQGMNCNSLGVVLPWSLFRRPLVRRTINYYSG
jgi:hypothetical protein